MRHILGCGLAGSLILATASWSAPARSQTYTEQTAASLEQQGKTAEAEDAWRAVSKAQPANPLPFAHLGLLEARQEHYTQAIAYYRKAQALSPAMPGLRLNMGLAYFKDGDYKEAIEAFTPLLKSASNADDTQRLTVLTGMSHYGLGQYASAVPYLKNASGRDAQNLPLLLTLAHSCLLSRQYQCVLDAYHQLVALNANSAEADMLVGEALDEMKDSAGATREFRAAVAANPKEPNAHFGLGYLLWTQKQYQEAAQEFQAELDNTPDYTQAMLYLADADIQLNQLQDASALLEKLVKSSPSIEMARLDLGAVYAETGRNEDALREMKAAQALKPNDVDVHWRLARIYRSLGNTAEAKSEFDKAQNLTKAADDALLDVLTKDPSNAKPAASKPLAPQQ
ncbi:MAG TPA: tetratricopeptide repeat protein [Terracidiphilus sp.]